MKVMNLQTKKFMYEGKEYEIRAARFEAGWEAAVFHKDKKVSFNYCEQPDESSVELLFIALESDVRNGKICAWWAGTE